MGAAICILTLSTTALAKTTKADVIGTWRTEIAARPAPDSSTVYLQTGTVLSEKRQDLVFSIYADPERQTKLFKYSSAGTWASQGPSKDVRVLWPSTWLMIALWSRSSSMHLRFGLHLICTHLRWDAL